MNYIVIFGILGSLFLGFNESKQKSLHVTQDDTIVSIPDENFEKALIDLGIDKDGQVDHKITKKDVVGVTNLNLIAMGIEDLNGIHAFKDLIELDCSRNELTELDLSKNINLKRIICNNNEITPASNST